MSLDVWKLTAVVMLGTAGCFTEPDVEPPIVESTTGAETGDAIPFPEETGQQAEASTSNETSTSAAAASDSTDDGVGEATSSATSGGFGDETSDGSATGPDPLVVENLEVGDLVITEVMWNPTCGGDFCEWFELHNTTTFPVMLRSLIITDISGGEGVVESGAIVAPGGFAILVRQLDSWNYEFDFDAAYGPEPGLNNNDVETLRISNINGLLDEMPLFPYPSAGAEEGIAWGLRRENMTVTGNDSATNWCLQTSPVVTLNGMAEFASPHGPTTACAGDP